MQNILKNYRKWKEEIIFLNIELEDEMTLSRTHDNNVGGKCSARSNNSVVENTAEIAMANRDRLNNLQKLVKMADVILDNPENEILKLRFGDGISCENLAIRFNLDQSSIRKRIYARLEKIEPYKRYFDMAM